MNITPDYLNDVAAAVNGVPLVEQAVAVIRRETAPPQHRRKRKESSDRGVHQRPTAANKPLAETFGGHLTMPSPDRCTLQDALRLAAQRTPDKGTRYLQPGGGEEFQSYAQLLCDAQRVLGGLRAANLRPGDSVLFQFDNNRNYITAFWACVLGGFLPTPLGLAPTYDQHNTITRKLNSTWHLLGEPVVLTDSTTAASVSRIGELWNEPSVRVLAVEELAKSTECKDWFAARPQDPVLHLLTSGSTGAPKCVRHTHRSVTARTNAAVQACGYTADDVTMNWMPLDHVSIVMYNVRDVFLGCDHINAKISMFLADPLAWLNWIDRHRATNTWAPNFAYAMVNDRAADISTATWDLSTMRRMTNAAEPVIARTAHRFLDLLAPHGLPADAMRPCWGMSETCSGVTYSTMRRGEYGVGTVAVHQDLLDGELLMLDVDDPDAVVFADLGPPIPGMALRVVDDEGAVISEDRIGDLEVRGDPLLQEYHGNPDAQLESWTPDGWFRTGDLAFLHNGSLVLCGRAKDQIIINGVNHAAHELEAIAEQIDGISTGYVAATAISNQEQDTDNLAMFFVPRDDEPIATERTVNAIRARLVSEAGVSPDFVVPVTPHEFPKTGSGKIQRGQLAADFRAGLFADRSHFLGSEPELDDEIPPWFFERVWTADPTPESTGHLPSGSLVVFAHDGVWSRIACGVPHWPSDVITVIPSPEFTQLDEHTFGIVATDPGQVQCVLEATQARFGPIGAVFHAWGIDVLPMAPHTDMTAAPTMELLTSLLVLTQQLLAGHHADTRLFVLTTHGAWLRNGDRLDPAKSALSGLVRTAATENQLSLVRLVDLAPDDREWGGNVGHELKRADRAPVVAHRDGTRWLPKLRPVRLSEPDVPRTELHAGGRYLITGGLGGIAFELAQYLLAAYQCRLLLVGRTAPDELGISEKASRLATLKELGDVAYLSVDVADAQKLRHAVESAEQRWGGPLNGVLHLAGADMRAHWEQPENHLLATETAAELERICRPKICGAMSVGALIADREHAHLVLFSSVNAEFGGVSFGAYSAANSFLSGYATSWTGEHGRRVQSLAWSAWAGIGISRGQQTAVKSSGFLPIGEDQGLTSFLAALSTDKDNLLIGLDLSSPGIIDQIAAEDLHTTEVTVAYTANAPVDAEALRSAIAQVASNPGVPVRARQVTALPRFADGEVDSVRLLEITARAAPAARPYVAPATDLERKLSESWMKVFRQRRIGRDDGFFELGGNSIQATQLVTLLAGTTDSAVSVQQLYTNPTIKQLAASLTSGSNHPVAPEG